MDRQLIILITFITISTAIAFGGLLLIFQKQSACEARGGKFHYGMCLKPEVFM